jgi:hypothetical protein
MVMTSSQRFELMRLLRRHPAIHDHVHPLWKLKRLQPVQLVDLASALGLYLGSLLDPGPRTRPAAVHQQGKIAGKKEPQPPSPTDQPPMLPRTVRLVADDPVGAREKCVQVVASNSDDYIKQYHAMSIHRVRLARAIALAIADMSPPGGQTEAVISARDALDALLANMAMILAASPSAATPGALDVYCRGAMEQLRGEAAALQADPELMRAIRSETAAGGGHPH